MGKKVLVVDDEKSIVTLLQYNLKQAGYEVLTEMDGEDGKNTALKENPDLIEYIHKTKHEIQNNNDIPDRLKKLFWNEEVINVIKGNGVESHLELIL